MQLTDTGLSTFVNVALESETEGDGRLDEVSTNFEYSQSTVNQAVTQSSNGFHGPWQATDDISDGIPGESDAVVVDPSAGPRDISSSGIKPFSDSAGELPLAKSGKIPNAQNLAWKKKGTLGCDCGILVTLCSA